MKDKAFKLKRELARMSPHLCEMLDGAKAVLNDKSNPMRLALASHALRELLREVLAHFAPDKMIKAAGWYVPDPSSKTGVTRKHRAMYAVYGCVNPSALPKSLANEVEDIARQIGDHVEKLSEYAHTTASVLAKPETEGVELAASTIELFPLLFAAINLGQETLIDELQMALTTALDDIFVNDFFDELDILSSHTRPTEAYVAEVTVTNIDKDAIYFAGIGSVSCELQYGSDGDCRRGDGVEWKDSFPFEFKGSADTTSLKPSINRENVSVDTSKYEKETGDDG